MSSIRFVTHTQNQKSAMGKGAFRKSGGGAPITQKIYIVLQK